MTSRTLLLITAGLALALSATFLPAAQAAAEVRPIVFPVEGPVTYSDTFGACRGTGCSRGHEGTDIMGKRLQRLQAATDGVVTLARAGATPDGSKGNLLIMKDAAGWQYWYIHINNDSPGTDDGKNPPEWIFAPGITVGSRVRAGQHIAYLGDSGNAEGTAPHLHFEIHRPDGTVINAYESLRQARRSPVTAAPSTFVLSGDFDDDAEGEVLVYRPGTDPDARLDATGTASFRTSGLTVNGTYQPLVGDFDGNGYDDILWYAPGSAPDFLWAHGPGGTHRDIPRTINGTYQPVVGDVDGNGIDDILWYAPGSAPDFLWAHRPDGSYADISRTINGTYQPVVGDLDGNGIDDILWYAPGLASDYLWAHVGDGTYVDIPRIISGSYQAEVGDFDGNGFDDVLWYAPGSAADHVWSHRPGGYDSEQVRNDRTELVTTGDFDGDGDDEILWLTQAGAAREVWNRGSGSFSASAAAVR